MHLISMLLHLQFYIILCLAESIGLEPISPSGQQLSRLLIYQLM
nr:MAG TPA: hypothetical protein [Caudoviricetes sp.]